MRLLGLALALTAVSGAQGVPALSDSASRDRADVPYEQGADLDVLLDRLGRYLIAYEAEITTVIADERYEQQEIRTARRGTIVSGVGDAVEIVRTRKLESEVAFLRLPGGTIWFGVRDVLRVDGKAVEDNPRRLQELLKHLNTSTMDDAARIVAKSAQYNLGGVRTINMPTLPLEILHPSHHVQFIFRIAGTGTIAGTKTTRLEFEEFDVPTIITSTEGSPLFVKGKAWMETESGRLWRVDLTITPRLPARPLRQFESRMRVDYVPNAALKIMVPSELSEHFWMPGGRGEGRARYSNFRQFGTSARIVPQQRED